MGRRRNLPLIAALLAIAAAAQTPQSAISDIKVTGAATIPAEAIIAASGLRTGVPFAPKDLDAAMNRLFQTGLLASVKYRYDPGPQGMTVTWIVAEDPPALPVVLDIAGVDEGQLWAELQKTDGMIRKAIPQNDNAIAYYRRAIQDALKRLGTPQDVTGGVEGDLATGNLLVIFRSANAPTVKAFRFEGNSAITTAQIESVLAVVAKGQEFSDRRFRQMLDLNVRPLYEERGYLTVKFPAVRIADSTAEVRIEEGPQWRLGKVSLQGDGIPAERMLQAASFPEGQLANWKQITASIQDAERVLKSEGYLRVASRPVRRFRDDASIVDLTVDIQKGQQFVFGELKIEGLSRFNQERALSIWKLKPGQPMNEPYVTDFLRSLGDAGIPFQNVNLNVEPRPGANIVDVTIGFK